MGSTYDVCITCLKRVGLRKNKRLRSQEARGGSWRVVVRVEESEGGWVKAGGRRRVDGGKGKAESWRERVRVRVEEVRAR